MTFGSNIDAERQKMSQSGWNIRDYKQFFVNINKCLKPNFLELYIIL